MKLAVKNFIVIVLLLSAMLVKAQTAPFFDEIQNFKKEDSAQFPAKRSILFVGSSSFRNWVDVQSYFPGYQIINRGFGGSSLTDVIRYANDIIIPYQPKQIVIYCGENDLASSDTITPQIVFDRFKYLFELIRSRMKKVNLLYISIKPSPSRQTLMPEVVQTNEMIKNYLKSKRRTAFADVYHAMLNADGTPFKEIFTEDSLHMNARGYAIWKRVIEPYLKKS